MDRSAKAMLWNICETPEIPRRFDIWAVKGVIVECKRKYVLNDTKT